MPSDGSRQVSKRPAAAQMLMAGWWPAHTEWADVRVVNHGRFNLRVEGKMFKGWWHKGDYFQHKTDASGQVLQPPISIYPEVEKRFYAQNTDFMGTVRGQLVVSRQNHGEWENYFVVHFESPWFVGHQNQFYMAWLANGALEKVELSAFDVDGPLGSVTVTIGP